jgi:predicted nuclease of predicted toxin-antitoxin system
MIICDENLPSEIIKSIRGTGRAVYSIAENSPGISDKEIIDFAKQKQGLIITEDKDFGEWVFAHKVSGISVIFLRYKYTDIDQIISAVLKVLEQKKDLLEFKFCTITPSKIRIRSL